MKHSLHTFLTCLVKEKSESNQTPKFLTASEGISDSPNIFTGWSQLEYKALSHQGWSVDHNTSNCGNRKLRDSVAGSMAYGRSSVWTRISLDYINELKYLHNSCNTQDSVMLNVGNYEVVVTGNTSEPYDMVSLSSNSTDNKVDGWGYDLNDDVTGIPPANVMYSSPVASNVPHTCTELSLHLISQHDCFLVSYSQVTDLHSFSIDQQYLVDTSHSMLHDTKLMQYKGSFGKFYYSQTQNNTMKGGLHHFTQSFEQIHGLSAVNTHKYVRSFGFMLL